MLVQNLSTMPTEARGNPLLPSVVSHLLKEQLEKSPVYM